VSTAQSKKYLVILAVGTLLLAGRAAFAADPSPHNAAATAKAQPVGDPYLLDIDIVTGERLTKPIIIDYQGRELRFANQDSVKSFLAAPAKYLARIDKAMVQQQLPYYPLKTCVISGGTLGGDMGEPFNYIYGNRLVRFCCKQCQADFDKDPARYLARIDQAVIASQKAGYPLQTCPVSGEKLGAMGKPVDYVVGNRLVRFCCPNCIAAFNKDPLPALAKLDAAQGAPSPGTTHQATSASGNHTNRASSQPAHTDP
jgi:YHS domain-containing protein